MTKLTPMMAQYMKVKEQYPDSILMFRLGDFYEMFLGDALEASRILQITLTSRNKGSEDSTPMCGIPFHALDNYLPKLTRAGKKVAICDQVTAPNGKGIVEREVVRVVTPGTTFNENILESKANNYVGCIVIGEGRFGFAYCDITTGDFKTTETADIYSELGRVSPAEIIGENIEKINFDCKFEFSCKKNPSENLKAHFELQSLKAFGLEEKVLATKASSMLLEYLKETQKTEIKHVQKISFYDVGDFMPLDHACIRNLELFYTNENKKEGSLIWAMDNTITPMGGRMIRHWLIAPLLKKDDVEARLSKVDFFVGDSSRLRAVRECLDKIYDIERLLSRLSLGTGNARDLIAMRDSLAVIPELSKLCPEEDLGDFSTLVELISQAINDEAPLSVRDGGMIKKGYHSELDELHSLSTEGKTFIKDLQEREAKRTGISSLKVRYNRVFGYYIEISKTNLSSVPEDYIRKQTLVNAERYITPELKEYEEKVLTAEDKIKTLEYELFYGVRMEVVKELVKIQKIARAVAEIDVLSTFAFNAMNNNYCRPEILNNGEMEILNSRHPVVEKLNRDFVPNDCVMGGEKQFMLITGPNMGGKSTYLRQVALTVLMAQIGSYVPAESAKISLVDKIFTRVGANDNLSRGESTFMVEMQETAYILNNATERSLIILDEVGRGTSTYDGVSIAWAISEFIHDQTRAKTIFATHYHELIELAEKMPRAQNLSVAVRENEKEGVVFLYKIVEGGVDKSYGIEVAKLAGLPLDVVGRSRGVLAELENKHISRQKFNPDQISIFEREKAGISSNEKKIFEDIRGIDVNMLTPMEALQKLNEMKKNLN